MLKSCSYCGKIHDSKYECPKKPKRKKQGNNKDKFRWTKAWQNKREQINKRDKYMCQVCIRKLYDTQLQYNYTDIEVHHIESLEERFDIRLEDTNLICLCSHHHKMAESGEIPMEGLKDIVGQQEDSV